MDLKDRVRQRIEEIGESPITLAKSVGLERGYINDILIGRKVSIRGDKIALVARALRCDPSYLTDDRPPPKMMFQLPGIPVLGVCQSGVWRDPNVKPDFPATLPISPDIRFPNTSQVAYLIRGSSLNEGALGNAAAIGIDIHLFEQTIRRVENGMLVVVRRERGGLVETSMRMVEKGAEHIRLVTSNCDLTPSDPISIGSKGKGSTILAVITKITKLLL